MSGIRYLSIEVIDWLIEGMEARDGLITDVFEEDGQVCVLGSIGLCDESLLARTEEPEVITRATKLGLVDTNSAGYRELTDLAITVTNANDSIWGTPRRRKEQMLAWLREQRALKESGDA